MIAEEYTVSWNTVHPVITQTAEKLRIRPMSSLPDYLSFDEFKRVSSVKFSMSFIYCDALTQRVVEVAASRQKGVLLRYFQWFSLPVRKRVQTETIDMYEPYIQLVPALFPNAATVFDRFHIVQALNRVLNKCRVTVMNEYRYKIGRLYNKYKRYWKLPLKFETLLTSSKYAKFKLFEYLTNTQSVVGYLMSFNETLKEMSCIFFGADHGIHSYLFLCKKIETNEISS